MEVVGILLSLFLLMFFAYRGFSVILFAPVSEAVTVKNSYSDIFVLTCLKTLMVFIIIALHSMTGLL